MAIQLRSLLIRRQAKSSRSVLSIPPDTMDSRNSLELELSLALSLLVGLLIGSIAGILAGLFGIGGGIVIVPMLIALLKFAPSKAVGTSLAAMLLPVGIMAVWRYAKVGDVDFKVASALAVGIFFMAYIGAHLGLSIGNSWVSRGFGVLLLLVGIRFILA